MLLYWDKEDYLLKDINNLVIHVEVKKYNDQLLSQLTEKNNKFYNKLICEKELEYFHIT